MKLSATELRIGNLIMWANTTANHMMIERIEAINHTEFEGKKQWWVETEDCEGELLSYFEPLPLTEEWLIKFGFIVESNEPVNKHLRYCDFSHRTKDYRIYVGGNIPPTFHYKFNSGAYPELAIINYVHQLQNLYFALTGTELTIK